MKKVLIMGGSYFIGRTLVDHMLGEGYDVFTVNRGSRPVWDARIQNLVCDREDKERLKQILRPHRFDYVVDVSGLNGRQAEILCEALSAEGPEKFIFLSSSAVYDIENLKPPFRETDAIGENRYWTFYGKDKIDAEAVYMKHFFNIPTQLSILRPPYVYGEHNYAQRESFVFDHLLKELPVLLPDSNVKLQFIYIKDLANVVCRLLKSPCLAHSIYNVGNRKAVSCREWVECCAKAAGLAVNCAFYNYRRDRRTVREFFPFYDYDNVLDVSRIKEIYPNETDYIEGLEKSYQWYLQNRDNIRMKENVIFNEEQIRRKLGLE